MAKLAESQSLISLSDVKDVLTSSANDVGVDAISRLYEDILWKIFMENTLCPPDSRPLMIARHSSQVCRRWRATILKSSTIWGRLISLGELINAKEEWREEIVSRTGCALLWVHNYKADISRSRCMTSFLFNLLRQHWERIQILEITNERLDKYRKEFWTTLLQRPAQKLEKFDFAFDYADAADVLVAPWMLPSPLFNNEFPQLKSFSSTAPPYRHTHTITMYMPESWLRQLRTLILPISTAVELVSLLRLTPFLEKLEIVKLVPLPMVNDILSKVPLSRLKEIRLIDCGDSIAATGLLTILVPSEGCSLRLSSPGSLYPRYPLPEDWTEQAYSTIMKYAVSYCEYHRPTAISFYYDEAKLTMQESNTSQEGPEFNISVLLSNANYSLIEMLLTSCHLASVREFHLSTTGTVTATIPSLYVLLPFYSVTTLSANIDTLVLIQNHWDQGQRSLLFPRLQTLKMKLIAIN